MSGDPRFWTGRRVFVTGCRGFLGSWTVRELRRHGAFVVGLVRDIGGDPLLLGTGETAPSYTVLGRLEDFDCLLRALGEYEIETVLHLGAQAIVGTALRNPRGTFEANILGTWNLLEACRQTATVKRVVVASSDKAYGISEAQPYRETMPLAGRFPYDVSKSCADLIAQAYHASYGLPVCITRFANFYGGGDLNFSRLVPGTILSVLEGKPPVLRSDGTMVRDYIYILDGVGAYLLLAEAMDRAELWGRAYNFSLERPLSVLEVTHKILAAMGRTDLEPVILAEARAEIPLQHLSAARAREELGWRPRYSFEEGLAASIEWYRRHHAGDDQPAAERSA
ncbi:MAG TPA: NAD-dependent epimerase/dehydratase family protein [Stellaceae bacterium]|jgi:CDP-glucose 4,6-dehydratase